MDGKENRAVAGEAGVLKEVKRSSMGGRDRLFLVIEQDGNTYMGCLSFDDGAFCHQVERLLTALDGRPISEIGSINLSSTL